MLSMVLQADENAPWMLDRMLLMIELIELIADEIVLVIVDQMLDAKLEMALQMLDQILDNVASPADT